MGSRPALHRESGRRRPRLELGALPRKGALPGGAELDHLAKGRPQKRETPRQPARQLRASTLRFWRSRLAGYVSGLGPEVVSKALWKEPSAYRRQVPIQGSSTPFD